MFWGCISKHRTGRLRCIDGTMNAAKYKQVLEEDLIPEFNYAKENIDGDWKLMQDNAPCHTARAVKAFLREQQVEFIDWPPYSPDLNPIENVWNWIKHKLETEFQPMQSEEELCNAVAELWGQITPEQCFAWAGNYEKRLQAVLDARGMHTKY